ncbi:MAG: cupin domain-containing protein [Clostridiales bacterium]|nr:cupin domain-containing protein [Clostridiales bacterium]
MIAKLETMKTEKREKMRDGNGVITLTHLFSKDDMLGKSRMVASLSLPKGASIGVHDHVKEAEMYIITSGVATVTENGKEYTLEKGEAMFTGNGDNHSIENRGDEELTLYAVIFN